MKTRIVVLGAPYYIRFILAQVVVERYMSQFLTPNTS